MMFLNLIILQLLHLAPAATTTFESRSPSHVKTCGPFSGEFHLVYDVSKTFSFPLFEMKDLASRLFGKLENSFSNSRYSVGLFSDKGMGPFGTSYDICYQKLLLPRVGMEGMTMNPSEASDAIPPYEPIDGGDPPNSQLDALYFSALSRSTGWTNRTTDENGNRIFRVVMLATHETYHKAPDARKACKNETDCGGYKITELPLDNSVTEPDHCRTYDYPTVEQVARAFHSKDIIPLFLISKKQQMDSYKKLANWLNPNGVVVPFEIDVSDRIIQRLNEALDQTYCQPTTSTVAPPSTLPPPPTTKPVMPSTAAGTTKTKGAGGHSNGVVIGASVGALGILAVLGLGAAAVGANYYNKAEPTAPLEVTESFGAEPPGLDERDVVADVNLAEFT